MNDVMKEEGRGEGGGICNGVPRHVIRVPRCAQKAIWFEGERYITQDSFTPFTKGEPHGYIEWVGSLCGAVSPRILLAEITHTRRL